MNCKVCSNTSVKNPNLSFFRFPSDNVRCRDWAQRCDILDRYQILGSRQFYKSYRICSEHFDPKHMRFDGRKKRLLNSAVPEIFNDIKTVKKVKEILIDNHDSNDCESDFKLQLTKNLCRLCAENNRTLVDIYSWKGKQLELENKLKHIPIMINRDDILPLRVCIPCINKMSYFDDFVKNCLKADLKLRIMLDLEDSDASESSRNPLGDNETVLKNADKNQLETVYILHNNQSNCKMLLEELTDLSGLENEMLQDSEGDKAEDNSNIFLEKVPIKIKEIDFNGHVSLAHDYSNMLLKQISPDVENSVPQKTKDLNANNRNIKHTCKFCLKSFMTSEILEAHVKAHLLKPDEDGKFTCKSCDKVFKNEYRLNEHIRIHTGECPYKCSMCEKKFHRLALLKQHSLIHKPDKPYLCSICNTRSNRRGNLIQHMKNHYKTPKLQNLQKNYVIHKCQICFHTFPSISHLKQHEKMDHSTSGKCISTSNELKLNSFICGICRKVQKSVDSLKHHFKSHVTRFECQYCNKSFKFREVCLNHKRGHTGEMPFECTECGKKFRTRPSYYQHKNIHSKKKLFPCTDCGMNFKRKDTLKNHFRIHTGERPFACRICGFAFKQRGDCMKHEKNHKRKEEDESNETTLSQQQCDTLSNEFDKTEESKLHLSIIQNYLYEEEIPWTDNLITVSFSTAAEAPNSTAFLEV